MTTISTGHDSAWKHGHMFIRKQWCWQFRTYKHMRYIALTEAPDI